MRNAALFRLLLLSKRTANVISIILQTHDEFKINQNYYYFF